MKLTQQQAVFCRNVVGHFTSVLGVSVDDFAHTASIDSGRLRAISEGYGDELSEDEVKSLVHFCEDLKDAEAAEVFDLKRHGLPVPRTLAEVADETNKELAKG
jgi:hypothetical protein